LISTKNFFVLDDLVIIMVLGLSMISPKNFFVPDDVVITLVLALRQPDQGGSLHIALWTLLLRLKKSGVFSGGV